MPTSTQGENSIDEGEEKYKQDAQQEDQKVVDNKLSLVVEVANDCVQQRVDFGALVLTETLVEIQLQG